MRILSRYILLLYLRVLSLCLGALAAIYLVIEFLEKIQRFTQAHVTADVVALFFLNKLPEILNDVMPMSTLLATLLSLGILSRNGELTAMRSCGISISSISAPIVGAAFLSSLLILCSNEFILPGAFQRVAYIEQVTLKRKDAGTFFRRDNIWYREKGSILRARLFDPPSQTLKGVTLWETSAPLVPVRRLDARQAVHRDGAWILQEVVVREFSGGGVSATRTLPEATTAIAMETEDLKKVAKHARDMGFFDLREYCRKLGSAGYDASRYLADLHAKISYPFASLVMAFLAIPFSLRGGRNSGTAFGIAQSLAIGFAFFVVNAVMISLGQSGILPPAVAAWGANLLFALGGGWLALTLER